MLHQGTLSLDLDNLWAYLQMSGDSSWRSYPTYLDTFVPLILDLLEKRKLMITFFVVGKDASLDENKPFIKMIADRGHEIANHSYNHLPWMKSFNKEEVEREILDTEKALYEVTGVKPIGYRGPGFSYNKIIHKVLQENNYLYDSSLLPSFIGPLARLYYRTVTNLDKEAKERTKSLYGSFGDFFKSNRNHLIEEKLLEIPVTTIPYLKSPFHMSYLLFLAAKSKTLMNAYLSTAIYSCNFERIGPNFLLHPTDLMGGDLVPQMQFFPGMEMTTNKKLEIFNEVMDKFENSFQFTTLSSQAKRAI